MCGSRRQKLQRRAAPADVADVVTWPVADCTLISPVCCIATLQVVLLMPFLATDWSSRRQRLLRFASRFYKQAGSLVGVLQRLPEWLLDTLVAIAEPGAEPHTREGIKAMMNPSGVRNNLHLAMHEFR